VTGYAPGVSDIGGGGSAFDAVFLFIQVLGVICWIAGFAILWLSDAAARWLRPALILQAVTCVAAPLVWNLGFPSQSGIEGAGRVLLGAPTSLGNGALGCTWALVACHKSRLGWRAAWPFAIALAAAFAGWIVFLFA
jgi:hypothetical protein